MLKRHSLGRHTPAIIFALTLAASGTAALSGCNIVGPVYALAAGPEKIKAAHKLDKNRPTAVFVDDRASRTPTRAARRTIGQSCEETLLKEGVVADMISSRDALAVVATESATEPMNMADIGKALGADILIYLNVDAFTLTRDGVTYAPAASARLKVIDVTTKTRLFPASDQQQEWHTVVVNVPAKQGALPPPGTARTLAEQDLAQRLGREAARVFFSYEAQDFESRVGNAQ